ncbi:DUF5677 domain-containing protein [Methylomonas sp. TEB]|uniref:DUF5677 domain-containing protein n=1 Tax=Methylomonas sp. TEB TaxID=3398229 RepID=UPI0039F5468C
MTTATTALDELVSFLNEQVAQLIAASEIDAVGQLDLRDEIARQQLSRTAELVRGAAALGANHNAACLGIMGRCLLEQLIAVLWAIRSIENAQEHQSSATAELAKALKINLKAGTAKIKNRHTREDATAEFLETEQMKNIPKRRSVEELAREAEVSDLYTVFYRFMSLETHGHHDVSTEASDPISLCEMHLQSIGAISRAIGQACVWWLLHRSGPDKESIRDVLGLNSK